MEKSITLKPLPVSLWDWERPLKHSMRDCPSWAYLWKSVLMLAFDSSRMLKKKKKKATSWFNAPSPTDGINLYKRLTFTKVSFRKCVRKSFVMWGRQFEIKGKQGQGFICSHKTLYHGIRIKSEYNSLVSHQSETFKRWCHPCCSLTEPSCCPQSESGWGPRHGRLSQTLLSPELL